MIGQEEQSNMKALAAMTVEEQCERLVGRRIETRWPTTQKILSAIPNTSGGIWIKLDPATTQGGAPILIEIEKGYVSEPQHDVIADGYLIDVEVAPRFLNRVPGQSEQDRNAENQPYLDHLKKNGKTYASTQPDQSSDVAPINAAIKILEDYAGSKPMSVDVKVLLLDLKAAVRRIETIKGEKTV